MDLEKGTPPGLFSASGVRSRKSRREWKLSGRDAACPFIILALERVHTKAQLIAERAAEEAANGMRLPGCGFHDLL